MLLGNAGGQLDSSRSKGKEGTREGVVRQTFHSSQNVFVSEPGETPDAGGKRCKKKDAGAGKGEGDRVCLR